MRLIYSPESDVARGITDANPGRRILSGLVFGCLLLLGGCASSLEAVSLARQTPEAFEAPTSLADVSFFPQEQYQCGPAALATVLVASNVTVTPEELVPLVYVPEREGSFQVEILAAARSFGRLAYTIPPTMHALFSEVRNGKPVLVMQNLGLGWFPQWHYAVVKGFDIGRRRVILNSGTIENYEQSLKLFERTWARADRWAIVVLEPGILPATAEPLSYFNAVVALEHNNSFAQVEPAYISGLEQWPDNQELLMGYGNGLYGNGQAEAAADMFRSVIERHVDYAPAYNNLAQLLHEQGKSREALAYARQAVALGGIYLDTYQNTYREVLAAVQETGLEDL